jgi:gamma-glutamylcyclotransferase (GGCT)/AIG2-like uncharacterized protein YtfP
VIPTDPAIAGCALPFFVYGTLRRGQGNYRRLAGRTAVEYPAVLSGHALYADGLPWVVAAEPEARVVGELMVANPGEYVEVLADLDRLEGFRGSARGSNLYERVALEVTFVDESGSAATTMAWVYTAGDHFSEGRGAVRVEDGDWIEFVQAEGSWKRRCAVSAE